MGGKGTISKSAFSVNIWPYLKLDGL